MIYFLNQLQVSAPREALKRGAEIKKDRALRLNGDLQ